MIFGSYVVEWPPAKNSRDPPAITVSEVSCRVYDRAVLPLVFVPHMIKSSTLLCLLACTYLTQWSCHISSVVFLPVLDTFAPIALYREFLSCASCF